MSDAFSIKHSHPLHPLHPLHPHLMWPRLVSRLPTLAITPLTSARHSHVAQYVTSAPTMTPRIGAPGKAALDKWLDETTESGIAPALFIGVASKDEILYFNCQGEKVLGEPYAGQVDEDTSEWVESAPWPARCLCSAGRRYWVWIWASAERSQQSNYGP